VIAVDVGLNAYAFGHYFECGEGQDVLMSGYLGSIGFGFPAAMGAWAAAGGRCGGRGFRVSSADELPAVLAEAMAVPDRPALVVVPTAATAV